MKESSDISIFLIVESNGIPLSPSPFQPVDLDKGMMMHLYSYENWAHRSV